MSMHHLGRRLLLGGGLAALAGSWYANHAEVPAPLHRPAPQATAPVRRFTGHIPPQIPPPYPLSRDTVQSGQREWLAFRRAFVAADGRVVDSGNGGISHSEGQGVGLLFSATWDDAE